MNNFFFSTFATFLVGLISGWSLFELQEWRRIRLAVRELRRALVAELENAEVFVSTIVSKYARLCETDADVTFVANEIRWFQAVGRHRLQDAGLFSDRPIIPQAFDSLNDNQLVQLYSSVRETIGIKIITPVVESALSGRSSGLFKARQIQTLGMVRWQAYLLEQEAQSMKEFFQLTFTVTDESNHKTVVANHEQRTKAYALRARALLGVIRAALQQMR